MSRRVEGDAGVGLIEVVVATVILGVGVVALLAAYATVVRSSSFDREQAEVTRALTVAAEDLAEAGYVPACSDATGPAYAAAVRDDVLADVSITVTYWDGASFVDDCVGYDSLPAHARMQRLVIEARHGHERETLDIVKRAS